MSDKTSKVTFIFRNKESGISIQKVFDTVLRYIDINYDTITAPYYQADLTHIIKNLFYVHRHNDRNCIAHMTGGPHYLLLGCKGNKKILTIHDLVLLDKCNNRLKRIIFSFFWFYLPMAKADKITCISEYVRKQLIKRFKIDPNKIVTIYNPVQPLYCRHPYSFHTKKPVILHIGTSWNKNLENVIMALKGLNCKLVIIGQIENTIRNILMANKIDYCNKKNISETQLYQEYINCDIVSFPSIYEGFGMPIIEGQAVGRPVLTSNIEPMIEIAGNAACLVNPHSVISIKEGFAKLINNNIYRKELIDKGLINIKRFNVNKIAAKYTELYKSLL